MSEISEVAGTARLPSLAHAPAAAAATAPCARYYESLRIFGDLSAEAEARQQYAQWRCRMFSHLLENVVHENLSERVTVHDVYELQQTQVGGRGQRGTRMERGAQELVNHLRRLLWRPAFAPKPFFFSIS